MQSGGLEIEFQSIAHSTGDHEVPGTEYRSLRQASGHEGRLKMHDLKMQDWKMTDHVN